MELCSGTRIDSHDEVCFQAGVSCPVCSIQTEKDDLEGKVKDLQAELDSKE